MGMKACPNTQPHNKEPCTFNLIIRRWGSTSYCQFPAFALGYIALYFLIWSSQYTCAYVVHLTFGLYVDKVFSLSFHWVFHCVFVPPLILMIMRNHKCLPNLFTIQTIMYTFFVWERSYEDFISQTAQEISIYSIVIANTSCTICERGCLTEELKHL